MTTFVDIFPGRKSIRINALGTGKKIKYRYVANSTAKRSLALTKKKNFNF